MRRPRVNRGLGRELERSAAHRKILQTAAQDVAGRAGAFAARAGEPWMRRQAQLIVVDLSPSGVRVVNTDHAGHLAEWGSVRNAAHAPLRRAVRAAGLELRET